MGWPGEALVVRLVETLEKSGVGLFRPWQLRRVGKAEAEVAAARMMAIAAAERKIEALLAPARESNLLIDGSEPPEARRVEPVLDVDLLVSTVTQTVLTDQLRKEVNVEKAVAHAQQVLKDDAGAPPDERIDMDWFYRWRDCAGAVSSEVLQQVWGNVLAGELKAPGAFSFRTLDFIRNLTRAEADLIESLGTLAFVGGLICYGGRGAQSKLGKEVLGIGDPELRELEDLGLISGVATTGYTLNAKPMPEGVVPGRYVHRLVASQRAIVAATSDPDKLLGLGFYRLTRLGESVLGLVSASANEGYLRAVGLLLAHAGFEVALADRKFVSDNAFVLVRTETVEATAPSPGAG